MANELQNSLFTAIDTIIGQRVEELDLDKTIVGSIVECKNALTREYRVEYKGGTFAAYAQSDESYSPHTSVYISVPQNDFTQKKWILGKVSTTQGDKAITEVSTALDDYQIVGHNVISLADSESGNGEFGLWSYQQVKINETETRQYDSLVLYDKNKETGNYLNVDNAKLKKYMEKAIALLIEATFRTDLDYNQKNYASQKGSDYALEFSLIFEHGDNTYNTYADKFNTIAPNIIIVGGEEIKNLTFYDEKIRSFTNDMLLLTLEEELNEESLPQISIQETIEAMYQNLNGLKDNGAYAGEELTLLTQYAALLNDILNKMGKPNYEVWSQLFEEYENWFRTNANTLKEKRVIYSLTSDQMLGNPYLYKIPTEQYDIFRVDGGRFKHIESIVFYCKDFDLQIREKYNDIFVKDIEFYGLEELSSVNGDYRLLLDFTQGSIFDDADNNDKELSAKAKFYYQQELLSTGIEYYWFKKNNLVNNAGHKDYHIRGGVGWSWIEKPTVENILKFSKSSNTAYENVYKCLVVYNNSITLKYEFSVFNESNNRTIEIESNLGDRFQFDRGTPVLTCKLLDKNVMSDKDAVDSYPDSYTAEDGTIYEYQYIWSRKYESGQTIIFEKTYEEWAALYESVEATNLNAKSLYKANMTEMQGVGLNKNELIYPAAKIAANTSVIFECSVFRKKSTETEFVDIGSASIVLKNEAAAVINDYHIVIENGDQVFQYNEYGVSPCKEKVQENPVIPKDLICHLYDPAGLEVTNSQYTVKWEYPVENSLIIPPSGLRENPSNGLIQWHVHPTAPVVIQESYDYSALNNQITCIVVYDGKTITKTTEFYFGKMGDNGTNGTNVVAVIDEWSEGNKLDNEPLTLIVSNQGMVWNTGLPFNEATTPLELSLFRRNEYIDPSEYKNVKWTMAGGTSKSNRFAAAASSVTPHLANITSGTGKYSNYIVKGEAKLDKVDGNNEKQTHYAFYPIPVIEYESQTSNRGIAIDKAKTLKHILYSADGRNPLYNTNQGVFFNFSLDPNSKYTVSWEAKGGLTDNEDLPAFDLYYDKDSIGAEGTTLPANTLSTVIQKTPYVYIKPKDVYSGSAQNNHVVATIYIKEVVGDILTEIKIATVYIPIYISLNLYGLASLNAWDGNIIEINEDNNYIMAPQIGAGVKEEDNTFTGIVMGKATTYDSKDEVVGLLGYSKGRQSIFLDAETGNATFGLPEIDERDPNQLNLTDGRIELRPGGLSSISGWKINSRSLFNVVNPDTTDENYSQWGGLMPKPYEDLGKEYKYSIPHDKSGVLINSDPSYLSIKGKQLTTEDGNIDFTLSNTIVKPGDTFELQLDPNDDSIFTIYRHTQTPSDSRVGVKKDEEGNFYIGIMFTGIDEEGGEEDFSQYSVPIYQNNELVGWQAIDSIYSEEDKKYHYYIALYYKQKGMDVWSVREVPTSGSYYFSDLDIQNLGEWRREKRVGINQQGRFYTNALKSSSSSLNIDAVGAFGLPAESETYMGASFEVGTEQDASYPLIKMFTETGKDGKNLDNPDGTLFISGASSEQTEYQRPVRLYGKSITLLAENDNSTSYYSKNRIKIDDFSSFIGNSTKSTGLLEEANPRFGNFLFFSSDDSSENNLKQTRFRSMYSVDSVIGKITELKDEEGNLTGEYDWPLLLKDDGIELPNMENDSVNQITKINDGSLINKIYNYDKEKGGHILNYATGSLQLNKAKQLTEEITDNDGNVISATYGIDKALQINTNDILFGNVDTFEHAENDSRKSWGAELDKNNYTIGNIKLHSNITKGFQFIGDNAGTTLASAPRIGLYSNDGIDIQELSGKGLYLGSSDDEDASYLLLKPNVDESASVMLSSEHGYIEFNGNARGGLHGTGASNGIYVNPGVRTGYGIFDGPIGNGSYAGASIYAAKDIYLNNFTWFGDWNDDRLNSMGTNADHYLTYILVKMYRYIMDEIADVNNRVTGVANSIPSLSDYATTSWVSSNYVDKGTYNKHAHGFTYNQVNGLVSMIVSSGGSYSTTTQTASPQA